MITKLILENFEGHKKTVFDFSNGLNVFVGESDRGKSSVFRAFKLLTQNKPGGEWMRPLYWEGKTVITGVFSNPDFTLKRTRGKSTNTYQLNDDDPVAAGTSVPENIAALINMDTVNIQTQIERAFLMFESAGERGRILNKIAGLDEIDTTLDNAKKDVNGLTKSWKTERENAKTFQGQLDEFQDVESMERDIEAIESVQTDLDTSVKRSQVLSGVVSKLYTVADALLLGEGLIEAQSTLDDAVVKISAIDEARTRIKRLGDITTNLGMVDSFLKDDNFDGAEDKLNTASGLSDEIKVSKAKVKKLERFLDELDIIDQDIEEASEELKTLHALIPNNCTECGAEL